jgi:hypothetical protein
MNWHDVMSFYGYAVWYSYGFVILLLSSIMFCASRVLNRIKKQLRQQRHEP